MTRKGLRVRFATKNAGNVLLALQSGKRTLVSRAAKASAGPKGVLLKLRRTQVRRGSTIVLRVAASHDCGTIVNPTGANGQVTGGVVMGVGLALSEGTQIDEHGRQRNPHLLDYKLVTAADAPEISIAWVETNTPNAGPKGSKGVGEPPCVATAGAIANAITKVIGRPVRHLPMTPERVWAAANAEEER